MIGEKVFLNIILTFQPEFVATLRESALQLIQTQLNHILKI
jgi:hypothetical protein